MRFEQFVLIYLVAFCAPLHTNVSGGMVKMSAVDCQLIGDSRSFMDIENCRLKAVRRDYSELSVMLNFYQFPIYNVTGSMQLWKRANGFKPFLYNSKLDLCKLIGKANYRKSFEKYMIDVVAKRINLQKFTCPWNRSHVGFEKFGLTHDIFQLPLPSGTYRIDLKLIFNGVYRVLGKLYIIVEE